MNKKVKLLIITQKVDKNDDNLGFFHRWILEFAKYYEFVTVIALQVGKYNLPKNVKVLSLGKELAGKGLSSGSEADGGESLRRQASFLEEKIFSKIKYTYNFYKYIWNERKNYDAVFVHMNQEYVLLGWKFWKLFGKKIFLWRNHAKGNLMTRFAVLVSNKVFCTSPQSFTARFKKTKIMPVGIDTDFFKPDLSIHKKPNSILFLGRLDPVKNVNVFIEVLRSLRDIGVEFSATIAGNASSKNIEYEKMIHDKVLAYGLGGMVAFTGAVTQIEALKLYREHELYVNLTPLGSLDKTIIEALASGVKVLVSNDFFKSKLSENSFADLEDKDDLVSKIKYNLSNDVNYNLSIQEHSLKKLMQELSHEINIHNI